MPSPGASKLPVRPEFGPTLPELLRQRFGVREGAVIAVVAGLLILAVAGAGVGRTVLGKRQAIHRSPPVFNVLYSPDVIRRVPAHPGELMRLEARRGAVAMRIVVSPLRLPEYRGLAGGILPIAAVAHEKRLRREIPGFRLVREGKARVNEAPGYQIAFETGRGDRLTQGLDILAVEDERDARTGIVLSLRQTGRARTKPQRRFTFQVRKTYRSFRFGTERLR